MKIKKPFWLPFNVEAYCADTIDLSTLEHGALLLLRLHYWRSGPPPNEDMRLARITRLTLPDWRKVRPAVEHFFDIKDDWINQEWDSELEAAYSNIEKASKAGKKAAKARWDKERSQQRNANNSDGSRVRCASELQCDDDANYKIRSETPTPPSPARAEDSFLSQEEEAHLRRLGADFPKTRAHD